MAGNSKSEINGENLPANALLKELTEKNWGKGIFKTKELEKLIVQKNCEIVRAEEKSLTNFSFD